MEVLSLFILGVHDSGWDAKAGRLREKEVRLPRTSSGRLLVRATTLCSCLGGTRHPFSRGIAASSFRSWRTALDKRTQILVRLVLVKLDGAKVDLESAARMDLVAITTAILLAKVERAVFFSKGPVLPSQFGRGAVRLYNF